MSPSRFFLLLFCLAGCGPVPLAEGPVPEEDAGSVALDAGVGDTLDGGKADGGFCNSPDRAYACCPNGAPRELVDAGNGMSRLGCAW